jgi:hypothetical protein
MAGWTPLRGRGPGWLQRSTSAPTGKSTEADTDTDVDERRDRETESHTDERKACFQQGGIVINPFLCGATSLFVSILTNKSIF